MKGKLRLALCSFVITALLLGVSPVLAAPVLPHAFYGTVTIGDNDAPVDSVVSAEVGGVDCGSYSISAAGRYGNLDERDYLIVQGDVSNGDSIAFYVNGVSTGQTVTFEAGGGPAPLDLTVPETAPTVATTTATSVTTTSVTLNGNLASLGTALSADVSFEWGATTAYGNTVAVTTLSGAGDFNVTLTGLSPGTTYHFSAKAEGDGESYGIDRAFTTVAPVAAGGGGGGPPPTPPPGTTDVRGMVSAAGVFTTPVTATSDDGLSTLTIPEDTVGLTEELEPLTEITITTMTAEEQAELPTPTPDNIIVPEGMAIPEDAYIVSLVYDFGPLGATFDQPITLTLNYDETLIPVDVSEENLVIVYWNETAEKWEALQNIVVDSVNNTISGELTHFTVFTILGLVPPPPPPPAPAAFSVTNLSVKPIEVEPKEAVTISLSVANTGGTEGSYSVVLMINGEKEAEKSVTVAAGDIKCVTFAVSKEDAGSYSVAVDGLSASFTVLTLVTVVPPEEEVVPEEIPAKPGANWPLISAIIAGVVIAAVFIFLVRRRRAV